MPLIDKYQIARDFMFSSHPPTFYVGACRTGEHESFALSKREQLLYTQLYLSGSATCVYMRRDVISRIDQDTTAKTHINSIP